MAPDVHAAVREGASRLSEAGVDTPRLDAELLLASARGCDRTRLVLDASRPLESEAADRYATLIARRERREPVAYLLGTRPFRRLELAVDERVLIPRPETEVLVEAAIELLPEGVRVADVGTGSGAIALALADERPDLRVVGIDASAGALQVARANGERLGLRVEWLHCDLLPPDGGFDAVLANLPYVEQDAGLAPEIADFEPAEAVFGGPDGLEVIRRLITQAGVRHEIAWLVLEIGAGQADRVEALLEAAGFDEAQRHRDLAGHDRVLVGRR